MHKVKILNDTRVNLPKDTIVEVSEQEAERLLAFASAVVVEDEPVKPAKKGKR